MKKLRNWYKSKTINWSLLIALFGMVEINLPEAREMLGNYYGAILMLVAAVNIYLRHVTTKSLEEK